MDDDYLGRIDEIDPEHRLGTTAPIPRTRKDYLRIAFFSLLAVVALIGIMYLSGIRQLFFYQRTPAAVKQPPVSGEQFSETFTLPVNAYIITNDQFLGSTRDESSVRDMVEKASNIWQQAGISFRMSSARSIERSDEDLVALQYRPGEFIRALPEYDRYAVNALFIRSLQGINGISYGDLQTVAVADKTSVFDFRALAHEFGHVLGLDHVDDTSRLMSPSADDVVLTEAEIAQARDEAHALTEEDVENP